jgi:hypothetical protein
MKKIALIAAMGLMGMGSAMAQATATAGFTVSVTLDSKCIVKAGSNGQTLSFGTYEALGTGADNTASFNVVYQCTRGLASPSASFDGGTGLGVVAGLQYTLATGTVSQTSAGTNATTSSLGTAAEWTIPVTGTMPAGQAGTSGAATTAGRTMTLSF